MTFSLSRSAREAADAALLTEALGQVPGEGARRRQGAGLSGLPARADHRAQRRSHPSAADRLPHVSDGGGRVRRARAGRRRQECRHGLRVRLGRAGARRSSQAALSADTLAAHPRLSNRSSHGPDDRNRRRSARARKGRNHLRLRHSGRGDQSALRRAEAARRHRAHPRAPRRGRVAHGRGLHARHGRQHRRLHRNVRARRHRHDHRALLGAGGFDPDPLHHRPGAARAPLQGGFPGGRHRVDLEAGDQVVGDRARAGTGAARLPAGVPPDALRPPGSRC